MILSVASGKGGTGKTTVSVNLARMLDSDVRLLDCDVEEPNDHLFLKGATIKEVTVTIPIPEVDESLRDGCGECGRFCQYHAIVSFEPPDHAADSTMIASDDESHDHNHKPGKSRLTGKAGAELPQNRLTNVDQHDDGTLKVGEFHHHLVDF